MSTGNLRGDISAHESELPMQRVSRNSEKEDRAHVIRIPVLTVGLLIGEARFIFPAYAFLKSNQNIYNPAQCDDRQIGHICSTRAMKLESFVV